MRGDRERVEVLAGVAPGRVRGRGPAGRRASSRAGRARPAARRAARPPRPRGRPRARARPASGRRACPTTSSGRSDEVADDDGLAASSASDAGPPARAADSGHRSATGARRADPVTAARRDEVTVAWPSTTRAVEQHERLPGATPRSPSTRVTSTVSGRPRAPARRRLPRAHAPAPSSRAPTTGPRTSTARSAATTSTTSSSADPTTTRLLHRLDRQHVPRLAVRSRAAQREAAPLADRVGVGAVVLADHLTGAVHDLAGLRAEPRAQEALGVAVGDEADVVGVRLGRDRQPASGRLGPGDLLRRRRRRAGTSSARAAPGPSPRARRTGPWRRRARGAARASRRRARRRARSGPCTRRRTRARPPCRAARRT